MWLEFGKKCGASKFPRGNGTLTVHFETVHTTDRYVLNRSVRSRSIPQPRLHYTTRNRICQMNLFAEDVCINLEHINSGSHFEVSPTLTIILIPRVMIQHILEQFAYSF